MAEIPAKEIRRRIRTVEKYLRKGYPPPNVNFMNRPGAIRMAANELQLHVRNFQRQVSPNGALEQRGYKIRWDLFVVPDVTTEDVKTPEKQSVPLEEHQRSILRLRRMEANDRHQRSQINLLEKQVIELEDVRAMITGLDAKIGRPKLARYKPQKSDKHKHTAMTHISDIHLGEDVPIGALNGLNAYNVGIGRDRLTRLAHKVLSLLTVHFSGELEELVVMLAGDLISGAIHDELAKTDDASIPDAVYIVVECLAAVIQLWRKELGIPIRVICVPGNHGRSTKKNEWKRMVANSFDILICYFIEREFRNDPGVNFFYPESGEALFSIYRFPCLCLHGHNMGVQGGGQGVYGPGYAIIRGGVKTQGSYDRRGIRLAYIFTAHYHSTLKPLPFLYGNGSVIGPNEYSMHALKAIPEVAKQNLFIFHPVNGLVTHHEVFVGDPSEGSIYATGGAPNPDADISEYIFNSELAD